MTGSMVTVRQELDYNSIPRRKRGDKGDNRTPPTDEILLDAIEDYWTFIDMIYFQGGASNFGQCHKDLIAWSDSHGSMKELILMPRGHLKSTLMTVGKTLHRIYQNPNIRIFVGTATRELAAAFVREVKTYFEDPWLQRYIWNNRPHFDGRLIPVMERGGQRKSKRDLEYDIWEEETEAEDKKVVWRGSALQVLRPYVLKEPTLTVGSVGSQPTGFHFDELKLDDVINYDNVLTPQKRERVLSWIDDLISVLDDPYIDVDYEEILDECGLDKALAIVGGRITACGTRYDREDWYGQIYQKIQENATKYVIYQRNIYANGTDHTGGYLWFEKWSRQTEIDKRQEITAQKFASQYLNAIVSVEDQILAPDLMVRLAAYQMKLLDTGMVEVRYTPKDAAEHVMLIHPIMVIDPAAAVGADSDFTAIVVGGKTADGELIILDGAVGKWKSGVAVERIFKYADKWKLRRINVESVGGFKHFAEYIRSQFAKYRPIAVAEYKPTGKKEVRISNALEPLFMNGMVYIASHVLVSDEIRDQFLFFPRPTIHDDFPDAVAALCELSKPPKKRAANPIKKYVNTQYGGYR